MMGKRIVAFLAASAMLLTSGCGAVRHDLQYPGGYPGWLLDRHSFDAASSKKLLLLRATIVLAMAARMGQATVRGEDADAFALSLKAAAREINIAAADLYPVDGKPENLCLVSRPAGQGGPTADTCLGYEVNFESEVPLIEARLTKLVVAALPTEKSRQFLAAVTKGDVLGAAFKALSAFKTLAVGLHYANGSYRSGLEIVASQIAPDQCAGASYAQDKDTVQEAVGCLGLPTDSIFSRTDRLLPIKDVSPSAFFALMRIANGACTALPYLTADAAPEHTDAPPPAAGGDAVPAAAKQAAPTLQEQATARTKVCAAIWFTPTERPVSKP